MENGIYNYLTTHVREFYKGFDGGHDEKHFDEVYNAVRELGVNAQFSDSELLTLSIAAAYHDVGRIISDKDHEKYSVDILKKDINIKRWASDLDLITYIILEHRSSQSASSVYSLILKDADKISRLNRDRWIERVVRYNVDTYKYEQQVIDKSLERFKKLLDPNHPKSHWVSSYAQRLYGGIPIFEIPTVSEIIESMKIYKEEIRKQIINKYNK